VSEPSARAVRFSEPPDTPDQADLVRVPPKLIPKDKEVLDKEYGVDIPTAVDR
jgi:hypothetical protein